jgi:hypothetical protein
MKMKKQISEYGTHNIRPNPPASTIISKNKGYLKMNDDDHQTQSLVSIGKIVCYSISQPTSVIRNFNDETIEALRQIANKFQAPSLLREFQWLGRHEPSQQKK